MDINLYYFPVTFAIIKNFYNQDDILDIHEELERISPFLKSPEETGSASSVGGRPKKGNKGTFLDELYGGNRHESIILKLNRKIFNLETKYELGKAHWFFKYIEQTSYDSTLVSYYKQGDYYNEHKDESFITAIYYTWKEPKNFEGGDLYFGDFRVPIENNCLLIFPSVVEHRVTEVTRGEGRWAISQFISCTPPRHALPDIQKFMNFLDVQEFQKIKLNDAKGWMYKGSSLDQGQRFWHLNLMDDEFYSQILVQKIINLVKLPLKLDRVYANGQSFGQDGQFHQDSDVDNAWTFLLYTNMIDDVDSWRGETQFRRPDRLVTFQPFTNSALFFKSNLWHRGLGPSRHVNEMRITLAWKFTVIK